MTQFLYLPGFLSRFYIHLDSLPIYDWKLFIKCGFTPAKINLLIISIFYCYFSIVDHMYLFKQPHMVVDKLMLGFNTSLLWEFMNL